MNDEYVKNEGYRPLVLPERGEDLLEGRQYALTPLARLVLEREFGLANVPTVVECILRKVAKTTLITRTFNHELRTRTVSRIRLPAQQETFRAYTHTVFKFSLSLAKLYELAPYYDPSHQLPGSRFRDSDLEKLAKLEQDWFNNRHLPSTHKKLAGRTLRWWSKHELVDGKYQLLPQYRREYSGPRRSGGGAKSLTREESARITSVLADL
jgi:hypothetical protein